MVDLYGGAFLEQFFVSDSGAFEEWATLKREWLARVPLIRRLDHLGELLAGFERYYNHHRGHRRLGGATPSIIYQGGAWQKPDRSAKTPQHPIRLRYFPEPRVTVYELAA